MVNDADPDSCDCPDLKVTYGWCPSCKLHKALIAVRCLGCMQNFPRCETCYPTATSCSEACKEKHREKLGRFFAPDGPKIGGIGDIAI